MDREEGKEDNKITSRVAPIVHQGDEPFRIVNYFEHCCLPTVGVQWNHCIPNLHLIIAFSLKKKILLIIYISFFTYIIVLAKLQFCCAAVNYRQ